jgi:selenide,water dikinase
VTLPAGAPDWARKLLADPQTSGGLLVSCAPESVESVLREFRTRGFAEAAVIGKVRSGPARLTVA